MFQTFDSSAMFSPSSVPCIANIFVCPFFGFVFLLRRRLSLSLSPLSFFTFQILNIALRSVCSPWFPPSLHLPASVASFISVGPPPSHAAFRPTHSFIPSLSAPPTLFQLSSPTLLSDSLAHCARVRVRERERDFIMTLPPPPVCPTAASQTALFHIKTMALLQHGYKSAYTAFLILEAGSRSHR